MAGTYESLFCSKNECSFSDGDIGGGEDTQPLQDGKKNLNFAYLEVVGM